MLTQTQGLLLYGRYMGNKYNSWKYKYLIRHVGEYLKINRGHGHFDRYTVAQNYSTPGYT